MSSSEGSSGPAVLILAGSPSDLDLALDCQETLEELGIPSTIRILSAHRTPDATVEAVKHAEKDGYRVLIALAGLVFAPHLEWGIAIGKRAIISTMPTHRKTTIKAVFRVTIRSLLYRSDRRRTLRACRPRGLRVAPGECSRARGALCRSRARRHCESRRRAGGTSALKALRGCRVWLVQEN